VIYHIDKDSLARNIMSLFYFILPLPFIVHIRSDDDLIWIGFGKEE
jgi:hypothetical protein